MSSKQSVLIVAAHPDDDVLGCGGTIAKLGKQGFAVHVAFMTDGVGARGRGKTAAAVAKKRREAAQKACRILGVKSASYGSFPDNRMDTVDLLDVVKRVEEEIGRYQPAMLLTHHAGDLNVDHRVVHEAVLTACRPQKGHPVRTLLFFEVPSSTEWMTPGSGPVFAPNYFVDISSTLETKMAALAAYKAELRPWPHPRSHEAITHLAKWRGASVGAYAAEAFILGRAIA